MARLFPLGRRQWLIATTLAAALGVLVSTAAVPDAPAATMSDPDDRRDDLKDREAAVNDRLHGAHQDLDESSAQLLAATRALNTAQAKLASAQQELARTRGELKAARELDELMQDRLQDAETRLEYAEQALEDSRRDVHEAEDKLSSFIVTTYEYGSPSLTSLSLVLQGGEPSDFGRNMSLADSVVGAQSATIHQLEATKTISKVREEAVQRLRDQVAKRSEDAAENLDRMQLLEAQAEAQTRQVQSLVAERQAAEERAEKAKQIDLNRIDTLKDKRAEIKDRLQRIAERLNGPGIHVNNSGGWLSYPVANPIITSPYGMRFHPILHIWELHDGTDFGVGCGTPVYAAANGRVVSEYYDDAYGNRVFVSHGNVNGVSLMTSYNHLTSFVASSGEHVKRGELIAYSGTTGWSTGCHLHFSVYENGSTVDPMGWL
jgi:murein DD-endopeptidase MepM/ murein hydrolase activator NlpD